MWFIMEKANQVQENHFRRAQTRRGFLVFILCILLLTVVFMAVPRVSNQGAAYFAKQIYYNHGADRGPHLGQKPHVANLDSQTNSRKLLARAEVSLEAYTFSNLKR